MLGRTNLTVPGIGQLVSPTETFTDNTSHVNKNLTSTPQEYERDQLVRALVRRYMLKGQVPPSEWTRTEAALMLLSNSLLNSALTPATGTLNTEDAIAEAIQKRLLRSTPNTDPQGLDRTLRFSQLFAQLRLLLSVPRLWQFLYFLLRVAEKSHSSGSTSLNLAFGNGIGSSTTAPVTRIADLLAGTNLSSPLINSSSPPPPPSCLPRDRLAQMQDELKPLEEYWNQFEQLFTSMNEISEATLLKDLILPLRGYDGTWIKRDERQGKFTIPASIRVLPSYRQLIECIGRSAMHVQGLRFLMKNNDRGIIRQSFYAAVEEEIRKYLVAVNEFEERVNLPFNGAIESDSQDKKSGKNGAATNTIIENEALPPRMTLARAAAFFDDYEWRLRHALFIVKQCATAPPGLTLLPILREFQYHGDEELATLGSRLFRAAERPFLRMIMEFVKKGRLNDPWRELSFIEETQKGGNDGGAETSFISFGKREFRLISEQIPTGYLPLDLAETICETGRTRAFLLRASNDLEGDNFTTMQVEEPWNGQVIINSRDNSSETSALTVLETSIGEWNEMVKVVEMESKAAARELAHLLLNKCQLQRHLRAIQEFLHFGRGDFAVALLESIGPHLAKPAAALFRHALATGLDDAILSLGNSLGLSVGNSLRDRMDVRLHESSNPKLTGWDVFTLDYRVDSPLDTFISTTIMEQHIKLSHFMWSLRRVAYVMDGCGVRVQNLKRQINKESTRKELDLELAVDFKRLALFLQEGAAVARQINVVTAEIVHSCWQQFLEALTPASGDDSIKNDNSSSEGQIYPDHPITIDKNDDRSMGGLSKDEKHRGLEYYQQLYAKLLGDFRDHLPLFSNPTLKAKLATVLSCLLRTDQVVRGYERYIALWYEYKRRETGNRSSIASGVAPEDEVLLTTHSFPTTAMRLLAEQRALFQATARLFQLELDELLLNLQKYDQEVVPFSDLKYVMLRLDYGGYHKQRNGFDQRKYCASTTN